MVANKAGVVINVVTQSAIVTLLHREMGTIDAGFRTRKIRDFTNLSAEIYSVSESTKAIQAFRYIAGSKVSAVPVLDAKKKLTGVISVRDIRSIVEDENFPKDL